METSVTTRRDGWTAMRRSSFLDHLGNGATVRDAAMKVGMSRETAYRLRRRDAAFAREWAVAQRAAQLAGADAFLAMLPENLRGIMQAIEQREAECDLRGAESFPLDRVTRGPSV